MPNQCKISKSLGGGFSGTPNEVWGTVDYEDINEPCVFFGMYDLRDYLALYRHKGKAWILWCGGDLNNLDRNFVLNDGKLKTISRIPGARKIILRILEKAEHWVENDWEASVLKKYGIPCQICPSFLGNVNKYPKQKNLKKGHYWCSASPCRQEEYGWGFIEKLAALKPDFTFHLYGATWKTKHKNVIIHGRISIEQMDKETKNMWGSLRLNEKDGFSEVTAKSILWGQHPLSFIKYPKRSRSWYVKNINNYPWLK